MTENGNIRIAIDHKHKLVIVHWPLPEEVTPETAGEDSSSPAAFMLAAQLLHYVIKTTRSEMIRLLADASLMVIGQGGLKIIELTEKMSNDKA